MSSLSLSMYFKKYKNTFWRCFWNKSDFVDIFSTKNCDFNSISDGRTGLELAVYRDCDLILLDICIPIWWCWFPFRSKA